MEGKRRGHLLINAISGRVIRLHGVRPKPDCSELGSLPPRQCILQGGETEAEVDLLCLSIWIREGLKIHLSTNLAPPPCVPSGTQVSRRVVLNKEGQLCPLGTCGNV